MEYYITNTPAYYFNFCKEHIFINKVSAIFAP